MCMISNADKNKITDKPKTYMIDSLKDPVSFVIALM